MITKSSEALGKAQAEVRRKLSEEGTLRNLFARPHLEAARTLIRRLEVCIADLNRAAGLPDEIAAILDGSVLQAAFPVLMQYRHGYPDRAPDVLFHIWAEHSKAFGASEPAAARPVQLVEPLAADLEDREYLAVFNAAVGEHLRLTSSAAEGRRMLRRLMTALGLSQDELGRMFGVTGETVRRWEQGQVAIPSKRLSALTSADAALSRLLDIFVPERLPAAIRRPAELFEGERALDWILRGRIAEVADHYDRVLAYQA